MSAAGAPRSPSSSAPTPPSLPPLKAFLEQEKTSAIQRIRSIETFLGHQAKFPACSDDLDAEVRKCLASMRDDADQDYQHCLHMLTLIDKAAEDSDEAEKKKKGYDREQTRRLS